MDDRIGQSLGGAFIVCVRRNIAALYHRHPLLTVLNQFNLECFPGGIPGAFDILIALRLQEIFQKIPSQFMREFECLDDTLFFQSAKRALLAELNGALQLQQGFLVAVETLLPADIEVIHGHLLFTQHRGCLHCLDLTIISKFQIDRIDDSCF